MVKYKLKDKFKHIRSFYCEQCQTNKPKNLPIQKSCQLQAFTWLEDQGSLSSCFNQNKLKVCSQCGSQVTYQKTLDDRLTKKTMGKTKLNKFIRENTWKV